jgi:hypothetical protein
MKYITKFRAALMTGAIAATVFAAVGLASIGQAHAGSVVCNVFGCGYVVTCGPFGCG